MEAIGCELSPEGDVEVPQAEMREKRNPGRGNGICTNRRIRKVHGLFMEQLLWAG